MKFSQLDNDSLFVSDIDKDSIFLKVKPRKQSCCTNAHNCIIQKNDGKKDVIMMDDDADVEVIGQISDEPPKPKEPQIKGLKQRKNNAIIEDKKVLGAATTNEVPPVPPPLKFGGGGIGSKYPKQRNPRNKNSE